MTDRGHSLEAWQAGTLVFSSAGKWLHPLLDLERFLLASSIDPATLVLHDKIVGRAAALLIIRLRIPEVHAGLLSRLGESALAAAGIRYDWEQLTDRIDCQTEEILRSVTDPDTAHGIILERARTAAAARVAGGTGAA